MFKKRIRETAQNKAITVIGKGAYCKGTLKAKGLVRIDGEIEGGAETAGDVIIGESGRASLDLKARHVAIAGQFNGTIEAGGRFELKSTGAVIGQIKANVIVIDDGARFNGSFEMVEKGAGSGKGSVDLKTEGKAN